MFSPPDFHFRADNFFPVMQSVAFIHLDLGIGGAENLVVNAAKGLVEKGLTVQMFTSHHDPSRSFKETTDGTLSVCFSCFDARFHSLTGNCLR